LGIASGQVQGNFGMTALGLKNAAPEGWTENSTVDINQRVGHYDLSKLPLDKLHALDAILALLALDSSEEGGGPGGDSPAGIPPGTGENRA
jgi:hypothetical protein